MIQYLIEFNININLFDLCIRCFKFKWKAFFCEKNIILVFVYVLDWNKLL